MPECPNIWTKLSLICKKNESIQQIDRSEKGMTCIQSQHAHSWPRLVILRSEKALSRPTECSILSHDTESAGQRLMFFMSKSKKQMKLFGGVKKNIYLCSKHFYHLK